MTQVILSGSMKTAVSIPDDLFRNGKRTAKHLGLSRRVLYQRALAAFLDRHSDRIVTESLEDVYGTDPEASRLDRLLENLQNASLPREEW